MSKKTSVYYFSPYDIQRPRTNQLADVHFCEGLQQAGCEVTLYVPVVYRKENVARKNINEAYGIEAPFNIKYLFTPTTKDISGPIIWLLTAYHCLIFIFQLFKARENTPIVISRSPRLMYPLVLLKKKLHFLPWPKTILWMHEIKLEQPRQVELYRDVDMLLCTNSAIKEDLEKVDGIDGDNIFVTLNPVTEAQARDEISKEEARSKLDIDQDQSLVVYTGKLFVGQKEAEYVIAAAKELPQFNFLLTGGKPHVVQHFREYCASQEIKNVVFTGYTYEYSLIRYYQQAADVLVSYYTPNDHLVRYNFPLKIMEYMLSGNPIVTPDFASTRDVLNEETAIFCEPENLSSFVLAIKDAFSPEGQRKGQTAKALASKTTYKSMGVKIESFITSN